jgi:hypothetical protein
MTAIIPGLIAEMIEGAEVVIFEASPTEAKGHSQVALN